MDFKEQIKAIASKVDRLKDSVTTEEATKNAFIMPFIQALGYNVFDPMEVVPEYVADVGIKQGEKIDYAILKDGEPIILIECKKINAELNVSNESQLFRYFHVSPAKFAILTNGVDYKFYTDLDEPNKMDSSPFLSFSLSRIRDSHITELKKFHKDGFNCDEILNTASILRYSTELKRAIELEINDPSEDFVRFFIKKIYSGVATKKIVEQFSGLVKNTFRQYITDNVTERLEQAISKQSKPQQTEEEKTIEMPKVITTDEELEAFHVVRAILCYAVPLENITYRDAQSYFAVLFKDNNRKCLCRLYLSGTKKYIGILDEKKNEEKILLNRIEDIYQHANKLTQIAKFYNSKEG